MGRKKVCLLSDHHLSVNPRLWKEAFFYEKEGWDVVILNMWQSSELLQNDIEILKGHRIIQKSYLNLIKGEIHPLVRLFFRLRKRMGSEMQKYLKLGTGWAISHAPELMVKKALKENADLYSAHLECSFFAGRELIKRGKKVSFDFEDWYSRDYMTPDRATKLLAKLEKYALHHGLFCTAASQSMADALQKVNQSDSTIEVIYNSFPEEELQVLPEQQNSKKPFRLIWTSRTVGPERGLETLVEALKHVDHKIELHIIGKPAKGYADTLHTKWNKAHKLVFHDFVKHKHLLTEISRYDLGLAIELREPDSRNKTVTNKILQYLQAGINVLATNTDGQQEIARAFPHSVFLVPPEQPVLWAKEINRIIINGKRGISSEEKITFQNFFSWDQQEQKFKHLISKHL